MKVAIIGCTHAGTAAVREIIRQDPTTEVNIYERNDNISFLSCGIALYLNGRVKQLEDMFYDSAEDIRTENIHVNLRHDVIRINRQKKELMVQDMDDFTVKREKYDKIIMCTGSMVSLPPIKGVNHARVMLCKNYEQAQLLHEKVKDARRVALVGGGYVNVELAESLVDTNHEVTLFQSHEDILNNYVDTPLSAKVIKLLNDHHVKVETNSKVVSLPIKSVSYWLRPQMAANLLPTWRLCRPGSFRLPTYCVGKWKWTGAGQSSLMNMVKVRIPTFTWRVTYELFITTLPTLPNTSP